VLQETAALDQLIDMLGQARSQEELAKVVGENIMSFDQRLWVRFAIRADGANDAEKKKLSDLSRACMLLVEAMVQATEETMQGGISVLQEILVAAADEDGEWKLPLPQSAADSMKKAMEERADRIDEALLASAYASMRKASEDGMDGVVNLVQIFLQLYAARELSQVPPGAQPEDAFLAEALGKAEGEWGPAVRAAAEAGEVSEVSLMEALQRRMESTVLGLASGSYAQRVQAEYLKEFEARAKEVFQGMV